MANYGKSQGRNTSLVNGANWVSSPVLSVFSPVFACTTTTPFFIFHAQMPCFSSSPVSVSSCPLYIPLLVDCFSPFYYHLKCRTKRYNFFTLFLCVFILSFFYYCIYLYSVCGCNALQSFCLVCCLDAILMRPIIINHPLCAKVDLL